MVSGYGSLVPLLVAAAALVAAGIAWDAGRPFLFGGTVGLLVLTFGVWRNLGKQQ
jgi:hypothetical protein